ncbi:hypothetical protein KSP39_PZI015760 [Platanthera zijinensis]|uniref:Uncharacterized protein n=1 Tax=Platanthera zijinensis TaxID=2320716 RepID=A0AAP0B8C4_9ASPA
MDIREIYASLMLEAKLGVHQLHTPARPIPTHSGESLLRRASPPTRLLLRRVHNPANSTAPARPPSRRAVNLRRELPARQLPTSFTPPREYTNYTLRRDQFLHTPARAYSGEPHLQLDSYSGECTTQPTPQLRRDHLLGELSTSGESFRRDSFRRASLHHMWIRFNPDSMLFFVSSIDAVFIPIIAFHVSIVAVLVRWPKSLVSLSSETETVGNNGAPKRQR